MKAVMKYPGSKWSLAKWIIDFFPEHHSYLEAFTGSSAVLFNKPRSNIETINDLDNNVINLFEWIKKDPERLAKEIYYTPYARQVYENAFRLVPKDNFEKAVNFYIQLNMGHGFRTNGEQMKVGLVDVDGHNFPNLPLMKLSAWHKRAGDNVEWWNGFTHYDLVYMSKVFDFTPDMQTVISADKIIKGGTGYLRWTKTNWLQLYALGTWKTFLCGTENEWDYCGATYRENLPDAAENTYPDYSLYPRFTESYGFLTRGCPRNCQFCCVTQKEGNISHKVADLMDFHKNQKILKLLDPNILACKEHENLLQQLIASNAWVDFTQGLDARLLTKDIVLLLQKIKIKMIHFAWDNEKDSNAIISGLQTYKQMTGVDRRKAAVYVLTNYDTEFAFDLYRVNTLRELGYDPYIMIYNKECAPRNVRLLQRWVNNRIIWNACDNFDNYNQIQHK